jgi:hypothetical protein
MPSLPSRISNASLPKIHRFLEKRRLVEKTRYFSIFVDIHLPNNVTVVVEDRKWYLHTAGREKLVTSGFTYAEFVVAFLEFSDANANNPGQ